MLISKISLCSISCIISSQVSLKEISCVVRCYDDPQKFILEFYHRPKRVYLSTQRDPLLSVLLSSCRILRADVLVRSLYSYEGTVISELTDEERDELCDL